MLGGGRFPRGGDANFIAQLNDDSFSGFFTDAFDAAEQFQITRHDGAAELNGGGSVQNGERGFRTDAGDVIDEETEEIALLGGGESIEDMGVFTHLEMGE